MAGRVLKITLEHTHPPIWRRIIIPDYITFQDLHNIIKILFGWDGYHLHRFENQKYDFYVEAVEDICSEFEYYEEDILVDDFIEDFSWIRYIYDFGDDWKHKIVYEKTDPSYNLRHATLLKYKGDNPVEDCGGVGPWLEFSEFDPISTEEELENLEIEKREDKGLEGIEYTDLEELDMLPEIDGLFDQVFDAFIKTARANVPGLENASDDEILGGLLQEMMDSVIAEGEIPGLQVADRDEIIHEQLELLKSGKPLTIVQSTKTLQKHLGTMTSRTIFDYLKYCRLTIDDKSAPEAVLANYFSSHVNILYYFFYKDEMEDLLEFWDLYRSGTSVVEEEYLEVIAKCIFLGLIRLKGKRKLKLELCAEFEQILGMVDRNRLDVVYSNIKDTVQTVGTLLMAYAALSFDDFYEMYSKYTKKPMERKEFETFIYWTGTMNRSITTFYYHVTGLEYLALPGMKESLADILVGDTKTLFQVKPRPLSQIEFKRWSEGFDSAIPEWQQFAEMLSFDNPVPDNVFFDIYVNIASGITMTELILEAKVNHEADFDGDFDDDEYDETEMLEFESDYWHSFAEICLTTPIAGLNGYSREQYAKEFNTTFDYIPLFDYSLLKKRITKYTHIYEFPSEIQLEMLEALRKGGDAYERVIRRLSQKYKSNLALQMECTTIASKKVLEKHPNFEASMNESNIYPWGMDDFDLPMPETYVRESKKIGRNDPCPCGSGKKYKKCCGR